MHRTVDQNKGLEEVLTRVLVKSNFSQMVGVGVLGYEASARAGQVQKSLDF